MESPTYLRAYRTFKNAGLSVREVALDDAGINDVIAAKQEQLDAFLAAK